MGGHVFRRSNRKHRSAKHTHEYRAHNVGADLQRQVCITCGHISITPLPPAGLRSGVPEPEQTLSPNESLSVVIDETDQPLEASGQGGGRSSQV